MTNFIKIHGNTGNLRGIPFITAIGVFDGVHLGHRKIISAAVKKAAEKKCRVMALSFSPHPKMLLTPDNPPELLISETERAARLIAAGADMCAFINFTPAVAALSPEDFLLELQNNPLFETAGICVGTQWRFGSGGKGNRETLDAFCRENGISLNAVEEEKLDSTIISSSAIRRAVNSGDLLRAEAMLGRHVQLSGSVVRGFQVASSKLSAPTANLAVDSGILPPDGVYCGAAMVDGIRYPAALNIGVAPTFGKNLRRVEIHLIGFSGNLYGSRLSVELFKFIRKEKQFDSPAELKKQIAEDIIAIKSEFDLQRS